MHLVPDQGNRLGLSYDAMGIDIFMWPVAWVYVLVTTKSSSVGLFLLLWISCVVTTHRTPIASATLLVPLWSLCVVCSEQHVANNGLRVFEGTQAFLPRQFLKYQHPWRLDRAELLQP